MRNRRLIAAVMASALLCAQALAVRADYSDQIQAAQNERDYATSELTEVQGAINDLEIRKQEIAGEIDSLDANLIRTIALIESLGEQIEQKKTDLEQTGRELVEAEDDQAVQYEAMKKRIQYLYETGGEVGWAVVLFEEKDLSNLLNRAEYTQKMYDYDRECLEAYIAIVQQVEELRDRQLQEKAELEVMRAEEEHEKAHLEVLLEEARQTYDNYEEQISYAEARAAEYRALIDEQNAEINRLVALQEQERRAAEEAARRASAITAQASVTRSVDTEAQQQAAAIAQETAQAAAEAAAEAAARAAAEAAAEEAARRQAEEAAAASSASSEEAYVEPETSGSSVEEAYQEAYQETYDDTYQETYQETYDETYEENYEEPEPVYEETYEETYSSNYNGVSGQDVVNYAMNFLGNPYVWGGNSLTNGVDCSGFVQQLYLHFGYSISRTTYTQVYDGIGVSYAEAQPGDLIIYDGHVALYMGGGQIIHASDPRTGIIIGNNPTYRPIIAVRRIIY